MGQFTAIAICFLLPLFIVAIVFVYKSYDLRKKTDLVAKALEQGESVDTDKLINVLTPKKKTLRQKLHGRLTTGIFFSFIGVSFMIIGYTDNSLSDFSLFGYISMAIGLTFIVSFFVGKNYLAKEIERQDNIID